MIKIGKWLVCAGWPYINGVPHLGTLIGSILSADVFARYLRLKGEGVVYVTGSDEHGTPIEVQAVRKGISPKEMTDKYHKVVTDIFQKFGIVFDSYIRTEDAQHIKFVQEFLNRVLDNGYIFTKDVEQFYCEECKRYLPDRFVQGTCPHCSYELARGDQCDYCGRLLDSFELIGIKCTICGTKPVVKSSKHWFYDLPKLTDQLNEYLDNNTRLPSNARSFSINWLRDGLKPRQITRDNKWGVPAPFKGAEDKTIYVWFEALLGYISATIIWSRKNDKNDEWKDYWFDKNTKIVYFVGKDNIPFHTIIFPSLLLASKEGYNLPWNVSSTEYLLFENKKFSKSQGIGIWLDQALEMFDADYWRYFLIVNRPENSDTNFLWEEFEKRVNSDLNDVVGNFVHRVLTFTQRNFDGVVPEPKELDESDNKILSLIQTSPSKIGDLLEQYRLKDALESVVSIAREGNAYLSEKEPWKTIKTDKQKAANTIFVSIQLIHALSILFDPFIPFTAEKIRKMLNICGKEDVLDWNKTVQTKLNSGSKVLEPLTLFNKVEKTRINDLRIKTSGNRIPDA